MRTVWSGEVVEAFPFIEFCFKINVAFIAQKLIEFLLVGSMRALNFAFELWGAALDVGMPDAEIFDMPVAFGLELMTIVHCLAG